LRITIWAYPSQVRDFVKINLTQVIDRDANGVILWKT